MPEDTEALPPAEPDASSSDHEEPQIDEARIARILQAATSAARQAEVDERRDVLTEVEKLSSKKSGVLSSLGLLVASIAAFALIGKFAWGWEVLVLILIVVAVHEAGHFIGMKIFGYGDVSMFFIPLFGGAVSGRSGNVPGHKRALVALMGPVPGLALGIVCWLAAGPSGIKFLLRLAQGFLLINAFNLLPFYPLDGGHLLNDVLFCRSRHMELVIRVLGGALLALIGVLTGYWVLLLLGAAAMLFSTGNFKVAGVADGLRRLIPSELTGATGGIPLEAAGPIIAEVRAEYPHLEESRDLAFKVDEIWERLQTRPPGPVGTIAILFFYSGLVLAVAVFLAVLYWAQAAGAAQ